MLSTGIVNDVEVLDHRLVAFPIPVDINNWALAVLYFPADLRKPPAERQTKFVIYAESGVKIAEVQRTAKKIVEGWAKPKSGGTQPRFASSLVTVSATFDSWRLPDLPETYTTLIMQQLPQVDNTKRPCYAVHVLQLILSDINKAEVRILECLNACPLKTKRFSRSESLWMRS